MIKPQKIPLKLSSEFSSAKVSDMKKDGNETLKRTLRHYIDFEFYANGVDDEIQELLEILLKECDAIISSQSSYSTKDSYSLSYKAIKEKVDRFGKELEERLEEEAGIVKDIETDFLSKLYGPALAIGGVSLSKLLFAPIDGRDTTKQFVERTTKNILRSYDTPLRAGYLFGQKSEEVTAQVSNQMKQVARGMQSGILTAIPSFAKTTDRIVFLNNNVEVVWCAVLDGRGCITCYSLNGLHFKSASLAPAIPHNRCRCVLCPAKDITEPLPTYEEYIESLSEDDQLHILGRNRYDLWKNYGIELKQFVNNGAKLRLDEIDLPPNLQILNSGARSKIVDILSSDDFIRNIEITEKYYANIRSRDNKDFISRIAKNSGKSFGKIEQIVNHVFKEKHTFEDGRIAYFDASDEIVKAFERLRTNEHTDTDILLLNHEFAELTYMKNKKYNIYEVAHKMANQKYDWEDVVNNAKVQED